MSELLPVLVADLANDAARDDLEKVAAVGGEAWVPLVAPPMDATPHLLEVYTPTCTAPLVLVAEPIGRPGELGYPLRLTMPTRDGSATPHAPTPSAVAARTNAGPSRKTGTGVHDISERHQADLGGEEVPRRNDPFIGRTIAGGKFEIESFVGRGMMGAVYRATHRQLRNAIAVKLLHEAFQHDVEFGRRFHAEALAASQLDHPNLVRVHDYGQEPDGLIYIAMEFLDGKSLRTIQQTEGVRSLSRIVDLMLQVTAGLAHAHQRGVIHRDVKPDNIVVLETLDDDGGRIETVKVCDFGLALTRASDALRERFAGTPVYMSPEQCRGEDLDSRSDVYSCGIMMYELATGQVPFLSDKPIVVVNRHLAMPPPPMHGIDPRFERIVQKALAKSKDDRHANMRDLRAELKALLAGADPQTATLRPSREMSAVGVHRSVAPPTPGSPLSVPPPPASAPPPASVPPRSPAPSHAPAWLEQKDDAYSRFFTGMATGGKASAETLADQLAQDPRPWLKRFALEGDTRIFATNCAELEGAIKVLAQRADAVTLHLVAKVVHGFAAQTSQGTERGAHAVAIVRLFSDPNLLGPLAEKLLVTNDAACEAAQALLVASRVAGAYALYGARVKHASYAVVRSPFVAAMIAIGEPAWPVIRAALEKISSAALTDENPLAAELACDLLLSVPDVRDEAAGHTVAPYVRASSLAVSCAATRALARLWHERARPTLFALLSEEDEGRRAAAITGLAEMGAMDEHTVRRLAPFVSGPTGPSLRHLALASLASITEDARSVAIPLLMRIVCDPSAPDDETVHLAARSLLAIAPERRDAVLERAHRSPEPLRSWLATL